jgi:hypothetical protein
VNLEFFDDGPEGRAIVLLYGGSCEEVSQLRLALRTLAEGVSPRLALHELPFVRAVNGCQLTALVTPTDEGARQRPSGAFELALDPEGWFQAEELLEPFERAHERPDVPHFQFLNPKPGLEILYSTHRAW